MKTLAKSLIIVSAVLTLLDTVLYSTLLDSTLGFVGGYFVQNRTSKAKLYDKRNRNNSGFINKPKIRHDEIESGNVPIPETVLKKKVLESPRFGVKQNSTWRKPNSVEPSTILDGKSDIKISTQNKYQVGSMNKMYLNEHQIYKTYFKRYRNVENVNCEGMLKGAVNSSNRISPQRLLASRYIHMTKNCKAFIQDRRYITHSLTEEEKEFPIAYSIMMYRYVEQTERLLRAIYRPQNVYCLHVDSTTKDSIYMAVKGIANCFDNVFLTSERVNVKWGTFTVLEPELRCMKELLKRNNKWKYFINLTGQEFPLKTNFELVRIFKAYNGSNDVEGTLEKNSLRWKRYRVPAPHDIVPTKGAVHIAASRGYVEYILHDQRAKDFLAWANHTRIPDETFFSTLNHNPHLDVPGSYKGYPETTAIEDRRKPYLARYKNRMKSNIHRWKCGGKWIRGICIFSIGDLPLLAERKELFANKFHLDYKPIVYGCLEELIFNRTRDEFLGRLSFDASWYASLDFVNNKVDQKLAT